MYSLNPITSSEELEERLREFAEVSEDAEAEVVHYLEDMEYSPAFAFEEIHSKIGTDEDWGEIFHPNSKEARELRKIQIDLGMSERVTEEDLSNMIVMGGSGKKYAFQLEGEKYVTEKSYSQVREELDGGGE